VVSAIYTMVKKVLQKAWKLEWPARMPSSQLTATIARHTHAEILPTRSLPRWWGRQQAPQKEKVVLCITTTQKITTSEVTESWVPRSLSELDWLSHWSTENYQTLHAPYMVMVLPTRASLLRLQTWLDFGRCLWFLFAKTIITVWEPVRQELPTTLNFTQEVTRYPAFALRLKMCLWLERPLSGLANSYNRTAPFSSNLTHTDTMVTLCLTPASLTEPRKKSTKSVRLVTQLKFAETWSLKESGQQLRSLVRLKKIFELESKQKLSKSEVTPSLQLANCTLTSESLRSTTSAESSTASQKTMSDCMAYI